MSRIGVHLFAAIVVLVSKPYFVDCQPSSLFHSIAPVYEPEQLHYQSTHHDAWMHSGMKTFTFRNRAFVVKYVLGQSDLRHIERAFASYERSTCIRFVKRQNQEDYLYIKKGNGCYSQVGRAGGRQELSLGLGCLSHDIIVHELMHSVGFWHEHSRADRDDHIVIRWENIMPGMKEQFNKISAVLQDTLGEQYDYESIMHYESSAFSKNGQNTIEATIPQYTNVIGTARDLSSVDVIKVS
uniref:Metalloendopeptidase n=1 Tax=Steinernema glaseri TaxID=37863 RepID=A0A1I7YYN3_9BILA